MTEKCATFKIKKQKKVIVPRTKFYRRVDFYLNIVRNCKLDFNLIVKFKNYIKQFNLSLYVVFRIKRKDISHLEKKISTQNMCTLHKIIYFFLRCRRKMMQLQPNVYNGNLPL